MRRRTPGHRKNQCTAHPKPLHVELEPEGPDGPEEPEPEELPPLPDAGAVVEVEAAVLLPAESEELLGALEPGAAGAAELLPSFLVEEYRSEYQPPPLS